jgi:hypothetical protein
MKDNDRQEAIERALQELIERVQALPPERQEALAGLLSRLSEQEDVEHSESDTRQE